jgi:hypothetical protein
VPITEYKTIKGVPYTADYFKLDYWPELEKNPKFDVSSIHKNVTKIDNYINSKIVNDGLKNNKFSYENIISNLKNVVGAKETEIPENIIKRISSYLDILGKQEDLDKKREKLLYGKFSNGKNATRVA